MPSYSVVIPVYNRPDELSELLESLSQQHYSDLEVIIVDDGSTVRSEEIAKSFSKRLSIQYVFQENTGQGFARNTGFKMAKNEYICVFDSDCILPPGYFSSLEKFLSANHVDAFGGPDAAHPSFTYVQKAISQSMTSFLTTGGIRGRKDHIGKFHPRSFNMGFRRELLDEIGGYKIPFMGEDLEFSTRMIKAGLKTALIPDAFVYHKRRTSLIKFAKQLWYFGRARINLSRFHPEEVKLIHLFPSIYLLGFIAALILSSLAQPIGYFGLLLYLVYLGAIGLESLVVSRSLVVAFLTPVTSFLQLTSYGYGFLFEYFRKLAGVNPNTRYTELY